MIGLETLSPGVIYLTLGTIQQLEFMLADTPLPKRFLYHPKREVLVSQLTTPSLLESILIITPKSFTKTGRLTKKGKYKSTVGEWSLPTDQLLKPSTNNYIFLICSDLAGTTLKKEAKSLAGGPYALLDLDSMFHDLPVGHRAFPNTYAVKKKFYPDSLTTDSVTAEAQSLILSLRTEAGINRWHDLQPNDCAKWFRTNETLDTRWQGHYQYPVPYLLNVGRAKDLHPYLRPTLEYMTHQSELNLNSNVLLREFAIWCWHTNNTWATNNNPGLFTKTYPSGEWILFKPSPKARAEWVNLHTLTPKLCQTFN